MGDEHIRRLQRDMSMPPNQRSLAVYYAKKRAEQPIRWDDLEWSPDHVETTNLGNHENSYFYLYDKVAVRRTLVGNYFWSLIVDLYYYVVIDGYIVNDLVDVTRLDAIQEEFAWTARNASINPWDAASIQYRPATPLNPALAGEWIETNLNTFDKIFIFAVLEGLYERRIH